MFSNLRADARPPSAEAILEHLLAASPAVTSAAPRDCRGIYALIDHLGDLRYIGSTKAVNETFYKRIHGRHRTGSEDSSHYFSRMYNTGRMWRLRNDEATRADGDIAKALRNAFIADHCRAVWFPLPDNAEIARIEQEVIALAPAPAIAWNRRAMDAYEEPVALVDETLSRLGFGPAELAALDRQRRRCSGAGASRDQAVTLRAAAQPQRLIPPFPAGPFRFFALDVETANNDRSSICQIGVAGVRPDGSITTWVSYVDPGTRDWSCSWVHQITGATVAGAPTFAEVLPVLERALERAVVYQHSSFDRSAIAAACARLGRQMPDWEWHDSVRVAQRAWPELKGNGGHGLASLKGYLGLDFTHHDAGEDARASAEIVLRAEAGHRPAVYAAVVSRDAGDFDVIECPDEVVLSPSPIPVVRRVAATPLAGCRIIGTTQLTQGNIDNHHIYLREFFAAFPADAIGGSSSAQAAARQITVDWGGPDPAETDLDGQKKFFRKRGWVRTFFAQNRATAGQTVVVEEVGAYRYRVRLIR